MQGPGGLLNIVTLPAGATQTQARMVIDGTRGAIFLYQNGSPFGGLVASWAATGGTDPYSNFYPAGLQAGGTVIAGVPPNPQVELAQSGGAGLIEFLMNNVNFTNPIIQATVGTFVQLLIQGARTGAIPGHTDFVNIEMNSGDGTNPANFNVVYVAAGGSPTFAFTVDDTGARMPVVKQLTAIDPTTSITPATPAISETWKTATLINSWGGGGNGINGLRYRMVPIGIGCIQIQGDILNATATGNSTCFTMPAGYHPLNPQNHDASWNDPQINNSPTPPWVFVGTNGDIDIIGIQVANKEIFFDILVPMD